MKKVKTLLVSILLTIITGTFSSCNSISKADAYNGRVDSIQGYSQRVL